MKQKIEKAAQLVLAVTREDCVFLIIWGLALAALLKFAFI